MTKMYTKKMINKKAATIYYNKVVQNEKIAFCYKYFSAIEKCWIIQYGF